MAHEELIEELHQALIKVNEDPSASRLLAEKAMLRAQRNGWIKALAFSSLLSGYANKRLRVYDEAIINTQRAITLFNDVQQNGYVANGYFLLGRIYVQLGEFSQAIEQFRKALTWISDHELDDELETQVHSKLCKALMNLGQWSEAEQELIGINTESIRNDEALIRFQLLVLRLGFYRGDQKSIREQLNYCRELVYSNGSGRLRTLLDFYLARYTARYDHVKQGDESLRKLWQELSHNEVDWLFLFYEAANDALQSDYPQLGVDWFNSLLALDSSPNLLKHRIHSSLAHFFVSHKSYEKAVSHYQETEALTVAMRESEVGQQWVRYRAEQSQHSLNEQIAQHKKNNQVLAESNAMLQAVNRIALAINAALDLEPLLKRLREQLSGWIDVDVIGIAEVKDDALHYGMLADDDRKLTKSTIALSEQQSWSVRSVNSGRILYENDHVYETAKYASHDINEDIRSFAFTPLKCEGRIIGLLALQSRQANLFDLKAISLLEYIAPVIGIAFANLVNLQYTRELSGALSKQQQELADVRQLMAHISDHDEITGLPNRSSLPNHFKLWKLVGSFYFFVLKIDNFNDINSELGFGFDEKLIRVIGQRLFNRLRPDDELIRIGEDVFLLITKVMSSKRDVLEFAAKILSLAEQPMREVDTAFKAQAHIGIVQYPDHGESIEELMSMAGLALKYAADDESRVFSID